MPATAFLRHFCKNCFPNISLDSFKITYESTLPAATKWRRTHWNKIKNFYVFKWTYSKSWDIELTVEWKQILQKLQHTNVARLLRSFLDYKASKAFNIFSALALLFLDSTMQTVFYRSKLVCRPSIKQYIFAFLFIQNWSAFKHYQLAA